VSDFRLKVVAETQAAERSLKQVEQVADKATRERKLNIDIRALNKNFSSLTSDIKSATNNIKTFYSFSKKVPGLSDKIEQYEKLAKSTASAAKAGIGLKENAKAGSILANSLEFAAGKGGQLINALAKVGLATFAIKEAVGVLQSAWNGFFNNTIGREIKLRETILKTQTTLASTNRVFANGREITDPYQKIVTLTGAVNKNIDSIRVRSIALAGVTSNDVIEVFGIVASEVGQIGGGLKEAEDLAINFAAALGTFGIPLYQARQEIGSILRGDITMDSYLAKGLGITNEDIAKAKTQTGGVVKFLEDRLAAAVAGQRIAAQGFSGVVSNIADLGELIGQNFGRGLLDPLLAGLTAVFESLFRIRQQLFDIASGAGAAIGRAGQLIVGLTAGRTGLGAGDPSAAASAAASVAQRGFTELERVAQRTVGALSQAIEALKPTALILVDAFKNIAEAFVNIKVGTFQALASALANIASVVGALAPSLATVFNLYARFLNTPAVQYFSEVAAVLSLLKRVGLDAATQLVLFGRFIFGSVIPAVGGLGTALGGLVAVIATVVVALGKLIVVLAGLATALVGPAAAIPAVAAALKALGIELLTVGKQAIVSGGKLNGLAAGFRGLGASAKAAGASILASLGWLAVIQIGISVIVDALGRYQRAQEDQRSNARAVEALRRLQTTYKDVGDSADSATKAARDFERAIVDANYSRNIEQLEEVRKKINQIRYELKPGIQSWGEFWDALSGSEAGRFEERSRQVLKGLQSEEAKIEAQLRGVDAERDRERAAEDIKLQAANRVNLEKEIFELRRQLENDLFQQRQALAQKEVEIFRVAGELRIKQIEKANAKLIEGEEGASRAALEALNNYIATRERGELEIEAAKKSLAIEVANLERQIIDYRLDIEKRIFELRKRAGENDIKSAQLRRQQLEAAAKIVPGGAVRGGAVVTQRNDPDGEQTGSDIALKGGVGAAIQNPFSSLRITKVGQQGSGSGSSGKGFGNYVTGEAVLNGRKFEVLLGHLNETVVRVGDVLQSGAVIGTQGITGRATGPHVSTHVNALNGGNAASVLRAIENAWVKGGTIQSRALTEVPKVEALQSASEIPDKSAAAQRYAEAVRSLAGAMERLRSLQAALTEANTAEAFDQIAKSAFPQVALEQYQDRLLELRYTYEAVTNSAANAFDPERSALEVSRLTQIATANREREQILKGIAVQTRLNEAERAKAIDAVNAKHALYLQGLQQENILKQRILVTEQATNLISQMRAQTKDIYTELDALKLRNRLEYEGLAPELIAAELAKLNITNEINKAKAELNKQLDIELKLRDQIQEKIKTATDKDKEALQTQLAEALKEIERLRKQIGDVGSVGSERAAAEDARARAQTAPGAKIRRFIGEAQQQLNDLEAVAVRVSQGIGDAVGNSLANGIAGLIEGTTTAQQVFSDFLKQIGQILVQEGTKMIAMYVAIGIAKIFAGMSSGGGGGGNSAKFGINTPDMNKYAPLPASANGSYFANGIAAFANGGMFTNSVVASPTLFKFADGGAMRTGVVGEAGPEAIMPLSRGSDGRLGVDANGLREAMSASNGSSGVPALNMTFETTTINGVEYVSREQLEAAMSATRRQATKDGAKQGMSMTLDRLQQSPEIRRRLGFR